MNKLTLISLLSLFPIFLFSQKQHEVKFDALGLTYGHYEISYEHILMKNVSLEIGLKFIDSSIGLDTTDFSSNPPPLPPFGPTLSFEKKSFQISVLLKCFLFPGESQGNRFYVGTYFSYETKPMIEDEYFSTYKEYREDKDLDFKSGTSIGLHIGYKLLILNNRLILEPYLGYGGRFLNYDPFAEENRPEGEALLAMKVGYRF